MHAFWETALSNALLVAVLAFVVAVLSRIWRNPAGLHVLWVLVLVKLFTPPLLPVGVPLPIHGVDERIPLETVNHKTQDLVVEAPFQEPAVVTLNVGEVRVAKKAVGARNAKVANESQTPQWITLAAWVWGLGIVVIASAQTCRVVRFRKVLGGAQAPPADTCNVAERIGRRFGLRRVPKILMVPIRISPMVWCIGCRTRVILPTEFFERLAPDGQEAILTHELAHVRRRDHLVRFLELAATTLFWWHPVVWWAARSLRRLEDQCCDAMVVDNDPDAARTYANALVDALDFLSRKPVVAPLGVTAARPADSLARRIEMLKNHRTVARLTLGRLLLLAATAAVPMGLALSAQPPPAEKAPRADRKESSGPRAKTLTLKMTGKQDGRTGPWKRRIFRLNSVPAMDMAQTINDLLKAEEQLGRSPNASTIAVTFDLITNSIVVGGVSAEVDQVGQLIDQLDEAPKRVAIQMLIAQATSVRGGSSGSSKQGPERLERVVDLGVLDELVSIASIEKRLTELRESKRLKILGRPRIVTIDNQSAFIKTGIRQATADDAKSRSGGRTGKGDPQEAGLTVGVTPRVCPNGTVVMEIDVEVSELKSIDDGGAAGVSSSGKKVSLPRIVTTIAQTTVSVPQGLTVVLGGIMATPFAPDEELLIILTPRIVQLEAVPEAK